MGRLQELVGITRTLRAEGGCPWDRAQTPRTLRPLLLEEAYEVLDAIDAGDDRALLGELGDLLFTVVLLAQIQSDEGQFDLDDVAGSAVDKMIRRHPHVFSDADYEGVRGWEAIKAAERAERSDLPSSVLDGVPSALPALLRAQRIGKKAASTGFDWPTVDGARAKLTEEIEELDEVLHGDQVARIEEELGDVLFSVVNIARHAGVSAEDCLRAATAKFEGRFRRLESTVRDSGADPSQLDGPTLEALWQQLKGEPPCGD